MSAKARPGLQSLATVMLAAAGIFPGIAWALDPMETLAAPFQDPLQAEPEVIGRGSILPGDGGPQPCPVQKDLATPLTLAEAVDLALCNNAQVKLAWASIKMQVAALGEARAAYLPSLSGTVSQINDQTRYPGSGMAASSVDGNTLYGNLSWRLLDFGGRSANVEAAARGLAAALAGHDASLQKTLSGVVQAYFDAVSARASWQARQQQEEIARNTLDTAMRRESRGAGSRSDTLQATTALARARLEKQRAWGAEEKSLSVLVYVTGLAAGTRLVLAESLEENPEPSSRDLEAWLEATRQRHPALQAARAQVEAARERVTVSRSEGLPTLDVSANYFENGRPGQGLSPTRTQERTLGIALNVPLFDGFARSYRIRGAEAQVEQRRAELQDAEQQILMEVVKAHADASAALENLRASEILLAAAQESLGVSTRKFERGVADILEILNIQSALAEARQERIRCQSDWRAARLRLLANAGLMGRNAVKP